MAAPVLAQHAEAAGSVVGSSQAVSWGGATAAGSYLYRYLAMNENSVTHTVTTPAGWTFVRQVTRFATGSPVISVWIYEIENASSRSGSESISWTGGTTFAVAGVLEFTGAVTSGVRDKTQSATNSAQIGDTGTTAATSQADEYALAIIANGNTEAQTLSTGPTGRAQIAQLNNGGSGSTKINVGVYGATLSATQTVQFTAAIAGGFNHNFVGIVDTLKGVISGGGGGGGSDSLVTVHDDSFSRNVAAGVGTSDNGNTYTIRGTAGDYNVDGDELTIDVPAANTSRRATVVEVLERDTDQTVELSADELAAGGNNELTVWARVSPDGNTAYRLTVQIIPATDQLQWRLQAIEASTTRTIGTVQTEAGTYAAGLGLKARLKVKGANPTTLSATVWLTSVSEPSAFELVVTDAGATLQAAGAIAIGCFLGSASTAAPVRFRFQRWSASRVVTGGATGSVTVTPSDRAVGAAGGGGGGGTPLPTGVGIRLGDQSSRNTWENLHAAGIDCKYMGLWVPSREVNPSPGTFHFYEPASGPGSGVEDSVVHARLKGYKLGVRLVIGKETPAWWYTHATKPVGKITTLNSDLNSNTGVPIDIPIPYDLPASSGSPHAPSSSGTNLRYWTTQLVTAFAAWLDQSIPDPLNPGQQIKRSSVVDFVAVAMAAPEGTEMWSNYGPGSYTDYTTIRGHNLQEWQQWSSYSGRPPALVGNTVTKDNANEAARRTDTMQAWLDSIAIYDDLLAPIGVKCSIMYGAIFADNHVAARQIVATFEPGGENRARVSRFYAGETNERAHADAAGFILYDTGLDASYNAVGVSRTTPPPRTWEGYASGPQNETLVRAMVAGCPMFLQTAAPGVFTDKYAGGSGAAAGFRACMIDAIEVWHARFFETTTTMILGNGGSIAASVQQAADAQVEQAGIAVADGYTSAGGGGGSGGSDAITRTFRPSGVGQVSRPVTDVGIVGLPDDDGLSVLRVPFVVVGGGGPVVERARWRFVLCDTLGEPIAPLDVASSRVLTLGIGIPWGLQFVVPASSDAGRLADEGTTRVKGYRNEVLRFNGGVWTGTDSRAGADSAATVTIQAWDALQRAAVMYADAARSGTSSVKFQGDQLHAIARMLVNRSRDAAFLDLSPHELIIGNQPTSSPARDRVFDPGTRLLAALQTLSERRDGIEFVVRAIEGDIRGDDQNLGVPQYEVTGALDISYPRIGGQSDVTLIYGGDSGNIAAYERTRDLWGVVNDAVATGATMGGPGSRFGGASSTSSIKRLGLFSRQQQFQSAKNRLDSLARGMLEPVVPYTLTITPNVNGPAPFDELAIGDDLWLTIDDERVQVDQSVRAHDLEITITDDGFEVLSALTVGEINPPEG